MLSPFRRPSRLSALGIPTQTGVGRLGRDRYVLQSAARRLEREGIVFVVTTGVGVSRANNGQIAALATDVPIEKIKRASRRARRRQQIVNIQELSADDRADEVIE